MLQPMTNLTGKNVRLLRWCKIKWLKLTELKLIFLDCFTHHVENIVNLIRARESSHIETDFNALIKLVENHQFFKKKKLFCWSLDFFSSLVWKFYYHVYCCWICMKLQNGPCYLIKDNLQGCKSISSNMALH